MIITGQTKIARNGTITNRTTNGDFANGANILTAIERLLLARGVTLDIVTPPEQHKHDDTDHTHAHDHTHTH